MFKIQISNIVNYKAPAKRSQHVNPTYCNIVGKNMLRAFQWPPCCDMLDVAGSNLTIFKLDQATPSMSQHIATGLPNARYMLRPTLLQCVALTCDLLAGTLVTTDTYSKRFCL